MKSFGTNLIGGVGGVVYQPYKGARSKGIKGMTIGVFKGIGGLIGYPIKGSLELIA